MTKCLESRPNHHTLRNFQTGITIEVTLGAYGLNFYHTSMFVYVFFMHFKFAVL